MTRRCRFLIGLTGCAVLTAGCAGRDGNPLLVSDNRTEAVLAAARAREINLFGELPGTSGATYFSRAAVSVRQHTFSETGADSDPDLDPTGRRIVFSSTRHNVHPDLYLKAVDGVAVTQLTADPASDIQPVFSPDGARVAFASNRSGNWDIWIIPVGGGPPVQVTNSAAEEVHPSWSPDGKKLVFCSLPPGGGQWELWIADAVAGSEKRFIGYGLFPDWSPVGDTIVYQRARERGSRRFSVWTLTLVDGEPRYPTEVSSSPTVAMILPCWSQDATHIAYVATSAESDKPVPPTGHPVFDIWVMNSDGTGKVRLTDGHTANHAPAFSPDGRLYFTSNRSGPENIWSLLPELKSAEPPGNSIITRSGIAGPVAAREASHRDGL